MIRSAKFWVLLAVFQLVFGLAVFALTRAYYITDVKRLSAPRGTTSPSTSAWSEGITGIDVTRLGSTATNATTVEDPVEISRLADDYFANKQYDKAATMYQRLLQYGPDNVETLNNLGLTLHYLGRSEEALGKLNDGVAADPQNQRIWLTLGYVNSQVGDTSAAREALTKATQVGSDDSIRQSAQQMLEELP